LLLQLLQLTEVQTTFVDVDNPEEIEAAIKDNTTCCVRYKNLTESELKVDFTVRFYYLRNN
jgi:O-acetylhomoserine/O-acetylserine sulfhydrylase-like pyridoxal-dependent enzyme